MQIDFLNIHQICCKSTLSHGCMAGSDQALKLSQFELVLFLAKSLIIIVLFYLKLSYVLVVIVILTYVLYYCKTTAIYN